MRYTLSLLFTTLLLSNDLSFQGFTGLINTPNAQIITEGEATFSFSNQLNNHLRNYDYSLPSVSQEDYMLGIGFLSQVEIVARLSEVDAFSLKRKESVGFEIRDLSTNIKWKLPLENPLLPNIAFGVQDIGSQSNYYTNTYAVMDKQIGILHTSLGYGKSGNNKAGARMDGFFGGVALEMTPWASLLAEHDGEEQHLALRFTLPKPWNYHFSLSTTIVENMTEPATSFALNISIPINPSSKQLLPREKSLFNDSSSRPTSQLAPLSLSSTSTFSQDKVRASLLRIQEQLKLIGFENIQVGHINQTLYIKCENNIFDHNDIDALGVILGLITQNSFPHQSYIITLLKNNIQTLTIQGDISLFHAYLNDPSIKNQKKLVKNLRFYQNFNEDSIEFFGDKVNSSFLKPRIELSPGIITTLGTEVGLFDYALSLRSKAYTTLYDGLTLSALYEIPIYHSSNFDDDKIYGYLYHDRLENRLVNTLLNQTLHYGSMLNTISLGRLEENYNGILNHTNITSPSGKHGINFRLGQFTDQENHQDQRNIYLGSYRYFYAPLDLSAEITYGQFWNQDKGSIFKIKRFFGDQSLAFYLKDTVETYAGFEFTLPLTARKSSNYPWGQIKGKKDFSYSINTVVNNNSNYLKPGGAIIPHTDLELESEYLNRDRLNKNYILQHIERLREAYFLYTIPSS